MTPKEKETKELITKMNAPAASAVSPAKLKPAKKLTMDATSIARLGQVICQTTGELEQIEMPSMSANGEKSHALAVPILDLMSNVQYLLICNALLVSALQRAGEPLAGKYFAIRSGPIKENKRYRTVEVVQLELAE